MVQAVVSVYMIILMQKDLQLGMEFFKKLGLKVVFYIPGKWCELQIGSMKIGLCPALEHETGKKTGIVFEVKDLHLSYQTLKSEGVYFLNEPTVATHGIMVTCSDLSGNIFDLYQPTHDQVKSVLEGKECCLAQDKDSVNDQCCKNEKIKNSCC